MNKEELLAYANENGVGSYISSQEDKEWFKEVIKDKEVVMAMVIMSESQCLLHGPLSNIDWKKDKDIVLKQQKFIDILGRVTMRMVIAMKRQNFRILLMSLYVKIKIL